MRLSHIALVAISIIANTAKAENIIPQQSIIIQTNIKTTEDNDNTVKHHAVQKPPSFTISSRLATDMVSADMVSADQTKIGKKDDKSVAK